MINVHASLLPRWRGASPIIHSLLNEDRVTGVSIMKIAPKYFDIGEVMKLVSFKSSLRTNTNSKDFSAKGSAGAGECAAAGIVWRNGFRRFCSTSPMFAQSTRIPSEGETAER